MPQGVIACKAVRSPQTFSAKPCMVIQRRTPTPIEAILRSSTQTPVRPVASLAATPISAQRFDQQLFQRAQVAMEILSARAKVENRIADELAGPVIGCLASAVDRERAGCGRCAGSRKLDRSGVRPMV